MAGSRRPRTQQHSRSSKYCALCAAQEARKASGQSLKPSQVGWAPPPKP